jgi:hypothetical protein
MRAGTRSGWFQSNTFAISLALIVCLTCLLAACTVPMLSALPPKTARAAALDIVPLCAWARNGRVGLWWNAHITPSSPASYSHRYHALCVAAPWPPILPDRGRPNISITP